MKEIIKNKYKDGIICFDNACFKSSLYGEVGLGVKETVSAALKSGDIEKASENYNDFKNSNIISFTDKAFIEAEKERGLDEPIDIIDDNVKDSIENTLFMKPIQEDEYDFEESNENTKSDEFEDNLDKSFILDFSRFSEPATIDSSLNEIEEVRESQEVEEKIEEEIEEEDLEKPKQKVISFRNKKDSKTKKELKKTGYVDTVILCLVAQLTIFGLLIVVLLMIK